MKCPKCGQSGAERPGLRPERYPEAVGFADDADMHPVQAVACNACEYRWVVPLGQVEVRKP